MKEKKSKPIAMDVGISESDRKKIVEGLSALLDEVACATKSTILSRPMLSHFFVKFLCRHVGTRKAENIEII